MNTHVRSSVMDPSKTVIRMDTGSTHKVSPAEVCLVVYETEHSIGIIKEIFKAFNMTVEYKNVDKNWEEELHDLVTRAIFIVSLETFVSKVKKKITLLKEKNNNSPNERDIEVLAITESNEDDDDDDDFIFDNEGEENYIIKVDTLNNAYKWWPSALQFIKPKESSNGLDGEKRYDCFFMYSEESNKESKWFKKHRDSLENIGIRCVSRERNSKIPYEVYMKSSRCVIMYVNNKRNIKKIKALVQKAVGNGCKIRLYLENARTEFAEAVRDECQLTLSGTTIYAHLTSVMKDLGIVDVKRREDNKFYSRTGDTNFRETYNKVQRPVTVRNVVPVLGDIYSFEYTTDGKADRTEETNICRCRIM